MTTTTVDPSAAPNPPTGGSPVPDWDLKVDEQVQKFLELKHKLTFFLVTAAVGALGFTLNMFIAPVQKMNAVERIPFLVWLVLASVLALLSAGAALLSLNGEIRSYQLHLKYRYERKTFEQIPNAKQRRWDRINRCAKRFQACAFACLFLSVLCEVILFLLLLTNQVKA